MDDATSDLKVKLGFRWQQSMGLMQDSQWRNKTRCSLTIKSGSNFIYKITDFNLRFNSQQSIGTDTETKYYTYAEMG
jgi:hypothetical protein